MLRGAQFGNICINIFQNVRRSEEKLCLITKPTFPRNKITSIPVKVGAEILKCVFDFDFIVCIGVGMAQSV